MKHLQDLPLYVNIQPGQPQRVHEIPLEGRVAAGLVLDTQFLAGADSLVAGFYEIPPQGPQGPQKVNIGPMGSFGPSFGGQASHFWGS